MTEASDFTLLVLSGMGIPPWSARGLTQTLEPIDAAAQLRRTVNGALVDVAQTAFRKYKSTITGGDQQPPALEAIWPGTELTVDCIAELAYETMTGSPARTVAGTRTEGDFTFYRPRLTMKVTGFQISTDEWGAKVGWTLSLEEV